MAKRQEKRYIFDASEKTVKIPGDIPLESLLLIVNKTDNIILYNFADAGKKATRTWTEQGTSADFGPYLIDGYTTFTLAFDTTLMDDTVDLAVFIEDEQNGLKIRPWGFGTDAIERIRVAAPQSLIDADFEYGLQATKWQNLGLNGNIPSFYENPGAGLVVSDVQTNGAGPYSTITVTVASGAPAAGGVISIFGTTDRVAEGLYLVLTSNGTTSFTYKAKGRVGTTTASIFNPYTVVKTGGAYTGTPFQLSSMTVSGTIVTVNSATPHGLSPGSPITIYDSTAGTQDWEGNFFVTKVVDGDTFEYDTGVTITGSPTVGNIDVYARSDSFFTHRPFDGGVLMGTYLPAYDLSAKRQTKRYFRYQSGKGILFSTGTLFSPTYDIQSATYSSGTGNITFTTQIAHGLQIGARVDITDIDSTGYEGIFTVNGIVSDVAFTVAAGGTAPTDVTADLGVQPRITLEEWRGTCIRTGMFDDTNGLFWAFEGDQLCVVRRSSTFQLAGTVSVTLGSTTVTGTNTRFTDQLKIYDYITIRGQRYKVVGITNQTTLAIAPEYRGATASGIKPTLIQEMRVPQVYFNTDKLDGTGPSGYTFNPKRMQMLGIQWSWYGAGFVDFMIRGPNGEFITAHRMVNNNVNFEAYMRSGNLPARYEITNYTPIFYLTQESGTSGDLVLNNTLPYPNPEAGYPAYIMLSSLQGGTVLTEIMSYTGKSGNTLTGTTRATSLTQFLAGDTRTFAGTSTPQNHPAGSGVVLLSNASPTISHWGSAVIMDGGFDEDTGYLFNLADFDIPIASNGTETILLFRPAPSVSDTISGALGEREVINRSVIKLYDLEIQSDRNLEIVGVLNPRNVTGLAWTSAANQNIGTGSDIYQPSFSQYVPNATFSDPPTGGEALFRFIVPGDRTVKQRFDLKSVKEIANSVIGGNEVFPDGPEVLALVVRNRVNQAATIDISLRWTEAQA